VWSQVTFFVLDRGPGPSREVENLGVGTPPPPLPVHSDIAYRQITLALVILYCGSVYSFDTVG